MSAEAQPVVPLENRQAPATCMESVNRIAKLPVVESTIQTATNIYEKVKVSVYNAFFSKNIIDFTIFVSFINAEIETM